MPNPAESAAQKLALEMGSWTSIEMRLTEQMENKNPDRKPTEASHYRASIHYIETAVGQRIHEHRMDSNLYPGETVVSIDYSDGAKCAFLFRTDQGDQPGQDQVTIKRCFSQENDGVTQRPDLLKHLYVGVKPLPEVLNRSIPDGEGRQLDRDCDRFLFRQAAGEHDPMLHVYWLDRATGITLRHEYYDNEDEWTQSHPSNIWSAQSIDEAAGRHLTFKSELVLYNPKGHNPTLPLVTWRMTTDEVVFNRDYPKTTFWPAITKQTKVIDTIANKAVFPKTESKQVAATADPIRAVDPVGWSSSYSLMALLLSTAVLGVGLLLYKRRG